MGSGGGSGRALVLFGFDSVWLRDLSMQLCFGFASDVFAKLHIYLIKCYEMVFYLCGIRVISGPNKENHAGG